MLTAWVHRYDVFPPQESWERARVAALDAVRIDYTLAEAHTSLGFVDLHYRRDWGSAEREFCTAILLNPRYAPARQWYAWLLAATGNPELAITALTQAVRMDPLSANANADLALAYYFSRQFDDAIAQCRTTLALYPDFYRAHQLAGIVYLQKGDFQSAFEHFQAAAGQTRGTGRPAVLLATALLAMGRMGEARAVFTRSLDARNSKASAIDFALFFAAIGDLDSVFQWLERAYEEQDAELLWLSVDPVYDTVRHDRRFLALLLRIGKPAVTDRLRELVLAPYEEESSSSPILLCTANASQIRLRFTLRRLLSLRRKHRHPCSPPLVPEGSPCRLWGSTRD
ncbi:MAG: tetratricopeptide repeat protein [Acidobacteriaceae bacterium]|nr:tetratricopeptide repeat protein [Acidobacteriaceae bacterium]